MAVGFSNVNNLTVTPVTTIPSTATLINNTNTMTADLSLNYLFNESLTGSVAYSMSYQTGGPECRKRKR